jgi:hypothetical protein
VDAEVIGGTKYVVCVETIQELWPKILPKGKLGQNTDNLLI